VDEEEAEDLTKMDSKLKLRRWDFETEEEWEKYEQNREAVPKYNSRHSLFKHIISFQQHNIQ
jgi:hypothetical protein